MLTLVLALFAIAWVAAALIGSLAYFMGEQTKPIHERNWNSDGFERLAQNVTGRATDYNQRTVYFGGDAFTSGSAS